MTAGKQEGTGTEYGRAAARDQAVSVVNFMVKPNGLLVAVSSACYHAYTSALSTW
jgi:hypothetical protein